MVVAAACGALLVAALAGGTQARAGTAGSARAVRGALTAADAVSALALAVSSGQPVEALDQRTEWQQVFALPSGGYEATESLVPVRARRLDGSWVPVDTRLSFQADGSVAPGAIITGLTLSGGGNGPLYTLSDGTRSLSASWPYGALPVPVLSGDTAVYSGVLPGVNLLVSATAAGVSELIEVTSASAAANPALARITLPVTAAGLAVAADAGGGLSAADGSGAVVYAAPAPSMWDSAGAVAAPAGALAAGVAAAGAAGGADLTPEIGDHRAVLGVSASPGSVSLTPPAGVLDGASTVYPVFIDPSWSYTKATGATWSDVVWENSGAKYGDWEMADGTEGGIRAGVFCTPDTAGTCDAGALFGIVRSFVNFPVPSGMWGASYVDAHLSITQQHAWGCKSPALSIQAYDTENASGQNVATTSTTSWPGPAVKTLQSAVASDAGGSSSSCPAKTLNYAATGVAAVAAANKWAKLTLRLAALSSQEGWTQADVWTWKRYNAAGMTLQYYWRNAPDVPAAAGTQGVFNPVTGTTYTHCATSSGSPDYVGTASPVAAATVTDADNNNSTWNGNKGANGGNVEARFPWQDLTAVTSGTVAASQNGVNDVGLNPNGGSVSPQPGAGFSGALPGVSGDVFAWQAYATTPVNETDPLTGVKHPVLTGPASASCYFKVDTAAPPAPAAPASPTYTSGVAVNSTGTPGSFTFTDTGANVAGFRYGFTSVPSVYVPASGGSATVTITPFNPAELDLYVEAVSDGGVVSPLAAAPFRIDTIAPASGVSTLGYWKINEGSGAVADYAGTAGKGAGAALDKGTWVTGTAGPDGYASFLSNGGAVTANPVVGNNGSFSVSAWVNLSALQATPVTFPAMSQDGVNVPALTLGYQGTGTGGCGCWIFQIPQADSGSPTTAVYQAQSAALTAANTNVWTQLTGVYDAGHSVLYLYVNGAQAGQATGPSPWTYPATGPMRLGENLTGTTWPGYISDACAFYGALTLTDAQNLYKGGAGDGCADLNHTYP